MCAPNNHRKKLNKCKKDHRSSKRNFCSQRKEGSSSIWNSYFHYFFFMFHLPSSSKLLKKLSQLPIGLPAQSVRALPSKPPFFSPSSSTARYKNPTPSPMVYLQNVYRERSISTILQKNRGLRTVYRHTASCGSLSWPWCLTSTQFPLPLPTPHPGPCVIELSLVKHSWKNTGRSLTVCGWIFSLKTAQTRKKRRDEHLALPWSVFCR